MNYFKDVNNIEYNKNTIVTIGTFDGVHRGHQEIFNQLVKHSDAKQLRSLVISFYPHPRLVVSKDYELKILTDQSEKYDYLKLLGIQNLFCIDFDAQFAQTNYETFFKEYIVDKIGVSEIVIGYDHRFGKNRSGNIEKVEAFGKKYNFSVNVVNAYSVDAEVISSTKIRNHLNAGELDFANKSLGRYYCLRGKVVEGLQRGRTLGFPTANIEPNDILKLIPKNGVYFVQVKVKDNPYWGLLNIGLRPTFDNFVKPICEVFIFDFASNIYGEDIELLFITKIRDEVKFHSADELVRQINNDKKNCIKLQKELNLKFVI